MQKPLISIIIPALNEGINVYNTVKSIAENTNQQDEPYEIIIINDGSLDGYDYDVLPGFFPGLQIRVINTHGIGLAGVKNYGAENSKGKFLLFLDAHMKVEQDWLYRLLNTAENFPESIITSVICDQKDWNAKGYGFEFNSWDLGMNWLEQKQNAPYPVPLAGGALMMFEKKFFNNIGGFDEGMMKWGREDSEISFRCWILGHSVMIDPSVEVGHLFRQYFPYNVKNEWVSKNILRFSFVHFNCERRKNVINNLKFLPEFKNLYNKRNLNEFKISYLDIYGDWLSSR